MAIQSWVSSTYCCCMRPKKEAICAIGEIYREKSRGPRTEPCGTPEMQMKVGDLQWPMCTNWLWPDKYDWNQDKYHKYADDTHFYASLTVPPDSSLHSLEKCTTRVQYWFWSNDLLLNPDKSEVHFFLVLRFNKKCVYTYPILWMGWSYNFQPGKHEYQRKNSVPNSKHWKRKFVPGEGL